MLSIKNIFHFENGDLCFCLVSLNIPYATFPKIGLQIQNIEAVNMTLMQKILEFLGKDTRFTPSPCERKDNKNSYVFLSIF